MHSPAEIFAAEDSARARQAQHDEAVRARAAQENARRNRRRLRNAAEALAEAHDLIEAAADALDQALDTAFDGVDTAARGRLPHLSASNPLTKLAAEIEALRPDHAIAERAADLSTELENYVEHLEGLEEAEGGEDGEDD